MVEGNSAGGGLRGARDATYQAIIFFKGKPLNAYNIDPVKVLVSDSWKHIIPTIGCGIPCDIKKMRYERIIICTDADIDGNHIRTLMCTFFLRLAPEIIRAGRLYIAEPPLYKLQRGKDVKYVATQVEYINECINSVSDFKISFNDGKPVDVKEFITDAFDYLTTLKECSVNRVVNGYLLEHIAMGFVQYKTPQNFINNIDKWLKSMAKFYREIGFDHNTNQITATIDLIDQFVLVDDELMVELENVIRIQSKYGVIINYESEKRNIKRSTELSQFFEYVEASYPQIKGRYKGLGTSDPDVLREVVTDPRTRRLYQVTIEDAMTMEKMAALVGNGKENINQRKEMLMEFKFTKADIDS
jgi:DNA gyrase subunit B